MFSIDGWIMKTCPIPVWPRVLTQWLTTAAIPVVRPWWQENAAHLLPVQKACRLAIACGARDKPGTDIYVFVQTVGFDLLVTKDAQEVRRFLAPNKGALIDRVVVHEQEVVNGEIIMRVDIYYRFIGRIGDTEGKDLRAAHVRRNNIMLVEAGVIPAETAKAI